MEKENTGLLYRADDEAVTREQTLIASASATFFVAESCTIRMRKTVDRENEYYFSGDEITFTIVIENNGAVAVNDLFFTDTLDEIVVPLLGDEYTVTTTSGTVTSAVNPITINNIDIPAGGSVTITITGRIA